MKNIAVLLNPFAGRGRALREKERLEALLKRYEINYDIDIFDSQDEEHLRNLAREKSRQYPIIVGAGGDGTFDIIINELIRQGHGNTFGMVPFGSWNDIAREFGVDSLENAVFAIKERKTRDVDLGILTADATEPLYFLGTASLGLGITVNKRVEDFMRKYPMLAKLKFVDTAFGVLAVYDSFASKEVPIQLTLEYDGVSNTNNFSLVVFNNTSFYAGGIRPSPDAKPDDGLLDFFCIIGGSYYRILYIYSLIYKGKKYTGQKDIILRQVPEFKIISERGIEIQTDGEVKGPYKEIILSARPRALKVIVHPNYVRGK